MGNSVEVSYIETCVVAVELEMEGRKDKRRGMELEVRQDGDLSTRERLREVENQYTGV